MTSVCQLTKYSLAGIAILALTGCTLRPSLVEAHVKGTDEAEIVEVILRSSDAKAIKEREIYFSIVVVDCENHKKRFPIEPYIAGKLASNFEFPVASEFVTAQGSMHRHVLVDFPKPCVVLQGGSYLFGKLESASVPLVRITE
jgi:hypothetical protein